MVRSLVFAVALIGGIGFWALGFGGGALAADVPTNAEILESFEVVVFGEEHDDWVDPRVTKWTKPVRLAVGGEGYQLYLGFLEDKVATLSRLTGHPIEIVHVAHANTLVVFTPSVVEDLDSSLRDLFDDLYGGDPQKVAQKIEQLREAKAFCYFGSAVGPEAPYAIKFARVFISLNVPQQQIYHCIVEELAQMMGLFNDSHALRHSIFNDSNNARLSLPEHDQLLLRTLYDRRIRPGMTKSQAMPIAAQILREIRPSGEALAGELPLTERLRALDDLLTEGKIGVDEYYQRRAVLTKDLD